jgi:hypothetical protein
MRSLRLFLLLGAALAISVRRATAEAAASVPATGFGGQLP